MKKCVALLLWVMLLLCACGEEGPSEVPAGTYPTRTFTSLEEFVEAAESAEAGDVTCIDTLTEVAYPVAIPEEYGLYKIAINGMWIEFNYLPLELLSDEDSIAKAEKANSNFRFCYSILSDRPSFDEWLEIYSGDREQLIYGRYFMHNMVPVYKTIMWEDGDYVFELDLPANVTPSDVEIAALCQTETISIDRVTDCPPAPIEYYSLEDFLAAVENPDDEAKSAELNTLTHITLPTGIPEGYGFYMIAAHAELISVYYFPVECLGNGDAIMEAKLAGRYYEFSEDRGSLDFESLVRQLGGSMDELVDGKYFLNGDGNKTVYWEQGGHVFWLNSPLDDLIWAEELPEICANETIELK